LDHLKSCCLYRFKKKQSLRYEIMLHDIALRENHEGCVEYIDNCNLYFKFRQNVELLSIYTNISEEKITQHLRKNNDPIDVIMKLKVAGA
jgi:hypothetical protein